MPLENGVAHVPTNAVCKLHGHSAECAYNISSQESDFFSEAYDGDANNFCNSQVPQLYELPGEQDAPVGSAACCYVPHKGIEDWWFKDGNVQVYG